MISAAAEPGTVVLGSSLSGGNHEMVLCFALLRVRGSTIIALTHPGTPVAAAADLVIPIELPEERNIFRCG